MLSREEIKKIYDQGPEAVIALVEGIVTAFQAQIEQLNLRVKELEDRLALNSRNSSQPPSSNGPGQRTKSLREPSGKKPGAQAGHRGTTLKASATPDQVVQHSAAMCGGCGQNLKDVAGIETTDRRQVYDLPEIKIKVTEHRVMVKTCPYCERVNGGQFPVEVKPGVQYGAQIKSLAVYLVQYHLLPWQRTCELIGDLLGQQIAEGTLQAALKECAGELEETEEQIKEAIIGSSVVHFDETGFYVAGRREWLHVASTPTLTHYGRHPKRGAEATTRIGILPNFSGRAVHDAWSSYFTYPCSHALCNAHHLRELTFVAEQMGQSWAKEFKELLLDIKQDVEQARAAGLSTLPRSTLERFAQQYDRLILLGLELPDNLTPAVSGKRGPTKKSKSRNLLDRLSGHKAETLAFMFDFSIPFDNNQAERDLRMMKVQQKISGCFRSALGAHYFCRIRGYISSFKKQGRDVLAALNSVFSGQPLSPLPDG